VTAVTNANSLVLFGERQPTTKERRRRGGVRRTAARSLARSLARLREDLVDDHDVERPLHVLGLA
jgi:hypothetical protein